MTISSYADLLTTIATRLGRPGDATTLALAPDFVQAFEDELMRQLAANPAGFVRLLETLKSDYSITGRSTALPAGWLGQRGDPVLQTSPLAPLRFGTLEELDAFYPNGTTGQPEMWTIVGMNLIVAPAPDSTYTAELPYYGFTSVITGGTNALLTAYPNVYLAGCLAEAFGHFRNFEAADRWAARRDAGIRQILDGDFMTRWPAGSLQTRVGHSTP